VGRSGDFRDAPTDRAPTLAVSPLAVSPFQMTLQSL
jgi:hypothetical protein